MNKNKRLIVTAIITIVVVIDGVADVAKASLPDSKTNNNNNIAFVMEGKTVLHIFPKDLSHQMPRVMSSEISERPCNAYLIKINEISKIQLVKVSYGSGIFFYHFILPV